MCLYVNQEATKRFKKFNRKRKKEITVYKVLTEWDNEYFTPYQHVPVKFGEELVASGDLTENLEKIYGGAIHVYTDLDAAVECANLGCYRIVVKCTAKASDFIANGDSRPSTNPYTFMAAFKAITIPEKPEIINLEEYY